MNQWIAHFRCFHASWSQVSIFSWDVLSWLLKVWKHACHAPYWLTHFTATWGFLLPVGFESGFEVTGSGFGFKKKEVDSDSSGFGFKMSGFGSGFEMSGFAHHWNKCLVSRLSWYLGRIEHANGYANADTKTHPWCVEDSYLNIFNVIYISCIQVQDTAICSFSLCSLIGRRAFKCIMCFGFKLSTAIYKLSRQLHGNKTPFTIIKWALAFITSTPSMAFNLEGGGTHMKSTTKTQVKWQNLIACEH